MKKFTQLRALLVMLMMCVGMGAWAEDVTFNGSDFTDKGTASTGKAISATKDGVTISLSKAYVASNADIRNYSGGTLTVSSTATITKIVFETTSETYPSNRLSTKTGTYRGNSSTAGTWTGTSSSISFDQDAQIRFSSITVTYSGSSKTLTSLAVSGTPTKTVYTEGEKFATAGLVVTGTYSDSSTEDVTSTVNWTINPSTGLTVGTTYVDVVASKGTVNSASYRVNGLTVNAIPTYTINYSVNGSIVSAQEDILKGVALEFPEISNIDDKIFRGWITESSIANPLVAPEFVQTSGLKASKDVTYYAVFADIDTPESTISETLTNSQIAGLSTSKALAYATEKTYSGAELSYSIYGYTDNTSRKWIQIKKDKGVYVKITAPSNIVKVDVEITSPTNSSGGINDISKHTGYSGSVGLVTTDCSFTTSSANVGITDVISNNIASIESDGSASTVMLKVTTGARIWSVKTYYGTPATYTNYCTTVSAPAPSSLTFKATSDNVHYYATFSSDRAIKFDEAFINDDASCAAAIKAYAVNAVDGELLLTDHYDVNNDGNYTYVPANTGILFKYTLVDGTFDGNVPFEYADAEADYLESVDDNLLVPASTPMTAADTKFYKLAKNGEGKLGFFYGATEGAAFDMTNRNGAYLAVPNSMAVKGFSLDAIETAILNIENKTANKQIYNLQGQRVNAAQKGIYIMNGRKVVK